MAIDSEEQKEILLGNKQLLSIFFIVVVLLGVAFTIGYTIGKNTATMHTGEPAKTSVAQTDPPVSTGTAAADPAPKPVEPAVSTAKSSANPPSTHKAEPYVAEDTPATKISDPDSASGATLANGSYLQVAALKREDADNIAKVLRNRGYRTVLGESSKEGLFRVLVGPFKNMTDLSESKQKLKASGMDSFVVR